MAGTAGSKCAFYDVKTLTTKKYWYREKMYDDLADGESNCATTSGVLEDEKKTLLRRNTDKASGG